LRVDKALHASYRVVDLREQNVFGICLIQLAPSGQRAHLNADACVTSENVVCVVILASLQLFTRALELADQARSIVLVREVDVVRVITTQFQKCLHLGDLCLALIDILDSLGGRRGHPH
jgi:hypothetical protein